MCHNLPLLLLATSYMHQHQLRHNQASSSCSAWIPSQVGSEGIATSEAEFDDVLQTLPAETGCQIHVQLETGVSVTAVVLEADSVGASFNNVPAHVDVYYTDPAGARTSLALATVCVSSSVSLQ